MLLVVIGSPVHWHWHCRSTLVSFLGPGYANVNQLSQEQDRARVMRRAVSKYSSTQLAQFAARELNADLFLNTSVTRKLAEKMYLDAGAE